MNYRNEAEFNAAFGALPVRNGKPMPKESFPWFTAMLLCASIGALGLFLVKALLS